MAYGADGKSVLRWHPVLLAIMLSAGVAACSDKPQQQAGPPPPNVTVANPVKRTVTDWDEFTGRFEAVEEVQVRSRVGGFVMAIDFKDGALIRKGDLLYTIDARPFEATAAQVEGQVADARARANLATRDYERAVELSRSQNVAEAVVDQRRQALESARGTTLQAEGALKRAQLDVEFSRVIAPISGRVSRHLVSVGNLVQGADGGATLLTTIVALDPIYVYFDMDETTYLRNNRLFFEGRRPSSRENPNPVQITLSGESKPSREGEMNFVDNRLDVGTGTLRGRAVVRNQDLSILPGQFARVRLIGSAPYETLLVPDSAIGSDQSRKIVFVVKDDNTVEARPVTLGPLDDGLRVIREGLKAEDRIVVSGLQRVRPGAKVTPQTEPQPQATGAKQ